MLAQTLNQGFVVAVADATNQLIQRTLDDRQKGVATPLDADVSDQALQQLATDLATAADAQRAVETDDAKQAVQQGDAPPPPKEDYAFMPRDVLLGILQTAFEAAVDKDPDTHVEQVPLTDDGRQEPTFPIVTDASIANVPVSVDPGQRRIWGKMEVAKLKILDDPLWVKSVLAMVHRSIHGRVPFNPKPTLHPNPLADNARLIIIGDWGSGLPRARNVADQAAKLIDGSRETHVIHLGDVYYSGEKDEYRQNFLDPWPVKDPKQAMSWTLAGNHDYYIGGEGYFGVGLKDPRFAPQQGSSWFRLANDHWQFLSLDSSYEDGGLYGDQAGWVRQMRADHPTTKTCLLTHHQLFSKYQPGAATMIQKLKPIVDAQPLDAWFWGHEHRCIAYRDVQNVRFASVAGHGGIPEYLHEEITPPFPGQVYEYRKIHSTDWQPWITFGFVVLDLDGPNMTITYIDEDGNHHYTTQS